MNKFATVFRFTFLSRVRTKSFVVSTIILVAIISLGVNLPYIIQSFSGGATKVGIIDESGAITKGLAAFYNEQEEPDIEIVAIKGGEEAAKQAMRDGEIKGYLTVKEQAESQFPQFTYSSKAVGSSGTSNKLAAALQVLKQQQAIAESSLTDEQVTALFAPAAFETKQISLTAEGPKPGKSDSELQVATVLVYILLFLLFFGIISFGNMVATEITAEKSSRVMELLVSSVSPIVQMFGKIVGICMLGLIQLFIYLVVGAINLLLPHNRDALASLEINISDIDISLLVYIIVFYLLGYFIYATMFAAIGSLVSRTEDIAQAIMPMTFMVMAGFYIGIYGLTYPTSTFIVVMSYVPFFSPMIMFLRVGLSEPAVWEVAISIALCVGSILGLGWLAAKIYRTGVLMYGKRPTWKELRKAMKAYRVG